MLGVFDGAQLGSNFSMWKYMYSKVERELVCTVQAQKAYSDYFDKYFANTSNGQLVDGLEAQEPRSGSIRIEATPGKPNNLYCHRRSAPGAWRCEKAHRSGSKSGSGRWSHWDEIGWVHYPEIGWSHSDEIRWVQSLEILHLNIGAMSRSTGTMLHCTQQQEQYFRRPMAI